MIFPFPYKYLHIFSHNSFAPLQTGLSSASSRPSSFLSSCGASSSTSTRSYAPPPPPPAPASSSSSILSPPAGVVLRCQTCQKSAFFPDEDAIRRVPENLAISRLVAKYLQKKQNERQNSDNGTTAIAAAVVPECQVCCTTCCQMPSLIFHPNP